MKKLLLMIGLFASLLAGAQATIKVEAEKYTAMAGVQTQPTEDEGGGENVSHIENGDWMQYEIAPVLAGTYRFDLRIANSSADDAYIQLSDKVTVKLPVTGDFQKWQTVSVNANLQGAKQILRLTFINKPDKAVNINWFAYTYIPPVVSGSPAIDLSSYLKKSSMDSAKNDLRIVQDSLAAITKRYKSLQDDFNSLPELNMTGFPGNGTKASSFVNKPLEKTQAERQALLVKPPCIIYQTDGVKGYYFMTDTGWVLK